MAVLARKRKNKKNEAISKEIAFFVFLFFFLLPCYTNLMALIEGKDIEFNYQDKELYQKVSFKINPGEHVVLIGANGTGKTTLLKLIMGELSPDKGSISWEKGVTYSYLNQNLEVPEKTNVLDYLYGVYAPLYEKEKRMEEYYQEAAKSDQYELLLNKAERLQEELNDANFYALQEEVGKLVDGLQIPKDILEKEMSILSGGQKEKVMLARMLLEKKDVLLLDEPTNFLDATQVDWLANYLIAYPKCFIVISHDQTFLKKIADVVLLLENQKLTRYKGDYDHYVLQHELDQEQYAKNYAAQQRYIKKEETFIAKHIVRATSARAAKSHRARLAHLQRMEPPGKGEPNVYFNFPFTHDIGEKPLIVEELQFGYNNVPLLDPVSFLLKKGEKIAILGRNGVGKTTFLRTILGEIPPISGAFYWLEGIHYSSYEQEEHLDLNLSPFEYLKTQFPDKTNTELRTALGSVGVRKELALRPMKELSGGERTKTRFALMTMQKSNFLIFDEPTNHLDQKAKDSLYEAIGRYPGSVIIVSHERDFYDGLVDYELYF